MLTTLPLYILRELGKAFGISLLICTFALLAIPCGSALRDGATVSTVITLIPNMFPLISPLTLPISVITGILICYGRLSANNEFVGSQASGVHPGWLALPALVVAILSSLITVYLNADVLTSSVVSIEKSLIADRTAILDKKLNKPGSFAFSISNSEVLAVCRLPEEWTAGGHTEAEDEDADLSKAGVDFTVFKKAEAGDDSTIWDPRYPYPVSRVLAKAHSISVDEDDEGTMSIKLKFRDGDEFLPKGKNEFVTYIPSGYKSMEIPKAGFNHSITGNRTQYMGIDKLKMKQDEYRDRYEKHDVKIEKLAQQLRQPLLMFVYKYYKESGSKITKEISETFNAIKSKDNKNLVADTVAMNNLLVENKVPVPAKLKKQLKNFTDHISANKDNLELLRKCVAEINTKLVMSFACISFAIIGIPIGLMGKRDNSMMGFAIGGGFAFGFYMVITLLHGAVRDGTLDWYALWMPNILVLAAGIALWYRNIRFMG